MVTFWIEFWYLVICLPVAIWVSWTLHKNGRVFLVEVFQGKEDLADSVNHMLVVGAYLVSIGFVTLAIKIGSSTALQDMSGVSEQVSMKVGLVLVVLGGSHFLNLLFLTRMRWRVRLVAPPGPDQRRQVWEHEEYSTTAQEAGRPDA